MAEFQVRSDAVDVEHIMRQIRQRIREKRGVDYTEDELKQLATIKLEKFLDPSGIRSDLVKQFRDAHPPEPDPPNYAFENTTLYETHRGIIRFIRRLLNPLLKLFFNPNPIVDALHIQAELNKRNAAFQTRQLGLEHLRYEVMHNLVMELTRASIEIRNLKMRLDSITGRLDFDERRQRAFEGVVQYRKPEGRPQGGRGQGGRGPEGRGPEGRGNEGRGNDGRGHEGRPAAAVDAPPQAQPAAQAPGAPGEPVAAAEGEEGAQRSRRRRRRRRRVPSAGMPQGGGHEGPAGDSSPGGNAPGGGDAGGGEAPSE